MDTGFLKVTVVADNQKGPGYSVTAIVFSHLSSNCSNPELLNSSALPKSIRSLPLSVTSDIF